MRRVALVALTALFLFGACGDDGTEPSGDELAGRYQLSEWYYQYAGTEYPLVGGSWLTLAIRGDSVVGSAALAVVAEAGADWVLGTEDRPQQLRGTWYYTRAGFVAFDLGRETGGDTWFGALVWRFTGKALVHDTRAAWERLHIRLARVG